MAVADSTTTPSVDELRGWLQRHRRIFVLTGAGCSTASGIPDYRAADGSWKRQPPVTYQSFVAEHAVRTRYWARSLVGWPTIAGALPNAAHRALAQAGMTDRLSLLVTQNVDGLHHAAGSPRVVDLHGRIDQVCCLACGRAATRQSLQKDLIRLNPDWAGMTATTAPDGDADLEDADFADFRIPACTACDGMLKPDVVFYGENVPRARVSLATDALHASDAMLVVGSSLMVYSGFRFARMAHEAGLPIAILTQGVTRADHLAQIKLEADCVAALPAAFATASVSV